MSFLMNNYARLPVAFVRGEGVWLWDEGGKQYLDAVAGVAVDCLGHAHPRLAAALAEQARVLLHTSNLYRIPLQEQLAEKLCRLSGMERAFFCNSGAEANEAAIKLARRYGHGRGVETPTVVVMEKSFHGRTLATLTATGSRKVQAGFEPLVQGFARVPYDDLEAVRQLAAHAGNVVAVLVETVQGEGGVRLGSPDYLPGLRALCDAHGWLLMVDEVQTGIGRTGRWFGYQHADLLPDVITLAKGLGSGFPVGACLARGAAAEVLTPGSHGSTFGGNPLACRAALTTLEVIESEHLVEQADAVGGRLRARLTEALGTLTGVRTVRGQGLMIGIELDRPCGELVKRALTAGLLINVTSDTVVRLLPPLILSAAQADLLADRLVPLVRDFLSH